MAKITKIKAKDEKAEKPEKARKPEKAEKVKAPKKKRENYFKAAWREVRQVRWPNRKSTWQMFLAVIIYTGIFMVGIMLLDAAFEWLIGLIF